MNDVFQREGQYISDNLVEKRQYMPGLDGLRALAVLAVIFYHLNLPWALGGFYGVTLFFVLSGYLITDILLAEWRRRGRIALGNFWIRRARRLLPAVFTLLICVTAYVAVFRRDLLADLARDLLPAALYSSNWWFIFHHVSYFQSFNPQLLNHFWSLAVEEQFYIFWPPLLILLLFLFKKGRVAVVIALMLASALAMALLFHPGQDPSRVYYGTDTRAFSLLMGAAMAFIAPSAKIVRLRLSAFKRVLLELSGLAALAGCLCIMIFSNQYSTFTYCGGMLLFSFFCAILILCAAHPDTLVSKVFSLPPLTFVGKISYGLYLWQYPIILLTNPAVDVGGIDPLRCVLQVALAVVLATASYVFIEGPIRRSRSLHGIARAFFKRKLPVAAALPMVLVVMALCASALFGCSRMSQNALPSPATGTQLQSSNTPGAVPPVSVSAASISPDISAAPSTASVPAVSESSPPSDNSAANTANTKITFIGDSIAIDVAPDLESHYANITVDGEVSRQFSAASQLVSADIEQGKLGDIVIIELGSNGSFTASSMRDLIELIGADREIYFVNANVPRSWCSVVNSTLSSVAAEYANVKVIDWYGVSAGHSEYFGKDAVHPNGTGSAAFAHLVEQAIGW